MINFESTKRAEKKNEKKIINFNYMNINNENDEEKIDRILKNLNNEDRELCFPLLDFYFLNKNFKYQNLKESLQINKNVNEYINLRLLKKEVYPKDTFFQTEQRNRENFIYSKLMIKNEHMKKDDETSNDFHLKKKDSDKKKEKINLPEHIPFFWEKDSVIGTFNPVYSARENIINDHYINSIPTIDAFYNSSKLLSIQTIFEPISNYISLLRLLPNFCLPLYDSGILQYVCEDPFLNPKLKGLELSYRLLVHDILFYALFSYLADLPFWAKPPIELLRIYNYESLYSFNDWESEHTERLVFHNIKNILYNFSDTINKIELLYPPNYYITIFPNIYFKNIIDFLKGENFKLKKIVIVIKGKDYIDEKMINQIKMNLENFKGITTENTKRDMHDKLSISYGNREITNTKKIIDAIKKCYVLDEKNSFGNYITSNNEYNEITEERKYNNKSVEKNHTYNEKNVLPKTNEIKNSIIDKNQNIKNNYKNKSSLEPKTDFYCEEEENKINCHEYTSFTNLVNNNNNDNNNNNNSNNNNNNGNNETYINLNNDMHKNSNEYYRYDEKNVINYNKINTNNDKIKKEYYDYCTNSSNPYNDANVNCNNNIKCSYLKTDVHVRNNLKYRDNIGDDFHKLKNIDISDNYNIDNAIYKMYYNNNNNNNNCQREITSIFENKEKSIKNNNYNSSESSSAYDDSDDENVDGFFKSKKLKSTVYDSSDFSFFKFMNSIINYEKIIDYLHNDPQRQENEDSKIKFYIKLLLFEKSYSDNIINENAHASEMQDGSFMDINERSIMSNNDESDIGSFNLLSCQNENNIENGIEKEHEENKEIEANKKSTNKNYKKNSSENNTPINRGENTLSDNLNNNRQNSSDYIGNLIRNLRLTYENNNFISFNRNEENIEENNFNLDGIQDSITRVTFNFN